MTIPMTLQFLGVGGAFDTSNLGQTNAIIQAARSSGWR